ncbi:putative short-chain dehydrogenase [Hypoxylon crocopeplum]|nr:putative short-chain dehydrogenase [Hypoxylon crocopeplum]
MSTAKGTIIVTGANGGLGTAIVDQTFQPEHEGYHGLYTVRDANSAHALNSVLSTSTSHTYDIISLDLTKLDSVRQIPPIQALILNAGFQDFGKQAWTDDGLDTTFSANYLGHWLLTLLLLRSMNKDCGRIVLVGSQSHDPYDKRNESTKAFIDEKYKTFVHDQATFEAIAKGTWSSAQQDPSYRSGYRRYGAAKLYLIMMQHELQRRMNHDPVLGNICILGVDPGSMSTSLQLRSTQKSASHVLRAAFDSSPLLGEFPKDLYFHGNTPLETSAESRDPKKRDLVWKETVRYANLKEGETILTDWR